MEISKEDRAKILKLFFEKLRDIEEIERYFKGKYTYQQIRTIIWRRIDGKAE